VDGYLEIWPNADARTAVLHCIVGGQHERIPRNTGHYRKGEAAAKANTVSSLPFSPMTLLALDSNTSDL
jgi:hypothetical protein